MSRCTENEASEQDIVEAVVAIAIDDDLLDELAELARICEAAHTQIIHYQMQSQ